MTLFNRFWLILHHAYENLIEHGRQDETEMLTSMGIYPKDGKSHVHIDRSPKQNGETG